MVEDGAGRGDKDPVADERNRYRRLQILVAATTAILEQDRALTARQGIELILHARRAAERLFPGKGPTFDLIYRPRLIRIMEQRFGSPLPDVGDEREADPGPGAGD